MFYNKNIDVCLPVPLTGGSIWKPPSLNPFSQGRLTDEASFAIIYLCEVENKNNVCYFLLGMPDELFSSDEEDDESRRRSLSKSYIFLSSFI